jgi:chemotaxis-related protein WspD
MKSLNDCWNQVGIQGDRSCPELSEQVHCRNCPMYTNGAVQILESRPIDEDATISSPAFSGRPPGSSRVVIFRLGLEYMALPAASIDEVTYASPVHTLPHRKSRLPVGLVNIRGELLLFVELAALLGIELSGRSSEKKESQEHHIVFGHAGSRFVFCTDEICNVVSHSPEDLDPVPTTLPSASFTTGVLRNAGRVIACLGPERLVGALNREVA